MARDNISIILINDENNGQTKTVNFSRRGLKLFSVFLVVSFFYVISLLFNYYKLKDERKNIGPLSDIIAKKNEILEKNSSALSVKIRDLNKKIVILKKYDGKLKNQFTSDNSLKQEGGIGGSEEETDDVILRSNDALEEYSEDILKQPDDLEKDVMLQEESFKELIKFLNKQETRLVATPAIWPVMGFVTSGFGYRLSPFSGRLSFHKGLDIAGRRGVNIHATADGVVIFAGWHEGGLGKLVVIDHGFGYKTLYGHNSRLLVTQGQRVKRRDLIALMGSTGQSTGPHSHYEVHVNGKVENPYNFILEW